MQKLLIANRGEIACRIMRSARSLGIATVAVYSEADAAARHVAEADEALPIGPAAAKESYLVAEKIIAAARESGADAIHPGYGFLAENAAFARAVEDGGLIWVGPTAENIAVMGDKERARTIAQGAGLPIVPGSARLTADDLSGLDEAAAAVGYPLLVKASAGGGGIGMRQVDDPAKLADVVGATQTMAERAFGDGTVYLEKLVLQPRHVEIQVFGHGDGRGFHLMERECSVQRRFQKIVEEAPSPAVDPALRARMTDAALALVERERYRGAGTVEFILAPDGEFYFLEMNTRIQVEHPATEMGHGDGRGFHLMERECSVQRRFQKIVEEAPSPAVDPALRARMTDAALALVERERYRGAGTVEFILAPDGEFYFLEMNTRIQVEHPATEMITGLDLVGLQLRLARGEDLSGLSAPVAGPDGHAIECRIYAENPDKNFLPSPGLLERFAPPPEGDGIRLDTGVAEGDRITPFYDPMIAKLVAHGSDRGAAIDKMLTALGEFRIEGIVTNIDFLRRVVAHDAFRAGHTHTGFVDEHRSDLMAA